MRQLHLMGTWKVAKETPNYEGEVVLAKGQIMKMTIVMRRALLAMNWKTTMFR